jgi:hypothetical protein
MSELEDQDQAAEGRVATGAKLLDEVRRALTQYVVLPSPEAADAVTLWTAASHAQTAWNCAPRLAITSPVKRCGKSRLLDVIEATCHEPLLTINISAAALARSVTDDPPTLLLDEADTIFGRGLKGDEKAETIRGIINAGHSRNRPYVRWDAATRQREMCPTFAMVALAAIGSLPETITDRSVVVAMRRRAPGETVARYREQRDGLPLRLLGSRLAGWTQPHLDDLARAEPAMPVEDRAADTWEPLFAIADLAGGDWPVRVAAAALALTAEDDSDVTLGIRLLADLRDVFEDADRMHTEAILAALWKIPEAPWGDYHGKPLNDRGLAGLLRPYKVGACDVKIAGVTKRGYRRERLHDPWTRYLPPAGMGSATSATSATGQVSGHDQVAGSTSDVLPATSDPPLTRAVAQVAEVADTPPRSGPADRMAQLVDDVGQHPGGSAKQIRQRLGWNSSTFTRYRDRALGQRLIRTEFVWPDRRHYPPEGEQLVLPMLDDEVIDP